MLDQPADATAIAAAVRAGRVRARAVIDDALARIAHDDSNAVVTVDADAARRAADLIDATVARGGDPGPLAGVPFTVKDTLATAGLRATAGCLVLADHVAGADAAVVARLRGAGAVLVGKTNCPEFALQPRTDNRVFGPTRHPTRADCSPGGSSGGCATAVARGLVAFSIGGDYGGSIRYPAACTGIYGLRPTDGAVPTDGHVPEPGAGTPRARFQTVGPLARSARDIALVFGVIADPDASRAAARPVSRIGIVRGGWSVTDAVAGAIDAAARRLTQAGYEPVKIDPSSFVDAAAVFTAWRASDDYADLRALVAGRAADLTPHIARLLATPAVESDVRADFTAVRRAVATLLDATPVVVLPVARVGVLAAAATTVAIGGVTESVDALQILEPSRAVSLLGLPALSVPVGLDRDGLPVGVQLVGRAHAEADLVAIATRLASTPAFGDPPLDAVERDG